MEKPKLHLTTDYKRLLDIFNSGAVFCAVDTETTGVKPETEHIIEIGAVKFTKDKILDSFSSLVNPKTKLNSFVKQLTGITDEMLLAAPDIKQIMPAFRLFCKDTIIVAHNAHFDLSFLNSESEREGLPPLGNMAVDTLRLSRTVLPENHGWKQTDLAFQFNINTGHAHRAFDDAKTCGELFKLLVRMPVPKNRKRRRASEYRHFQETYSLAKEALS